MRPILVYLAALLPGRRQPRLGGSRRHVGRAAGACVGALLLPALAACLPGTGEVKVYGDGTIAADTGGIYPEGSAGSNDNGLPPDLGPGYDGVPANPDTGSIPTPDATPAGPKPPYGSSVGMTAADFSAPDCQDKPYTLHPYFAKHKGVLVAMMSPS